MIELLFVIGMVFVGSAICSGAEAALFSVSLVKVRQLAQEKKPAAKTLLRIRENMSRPITTIVILNNIFGIIGSIWVGGLAAEILGNQWLGVFSVAFTFVFIIGSEVFPKTIGERYAETIALFIARPIAGLTKMMLPIVWLTERMVLPFTRGSLRPITNEAEIKLLAHIGQQEGSIEEDEAALIDRVFWLNDMTASMLMTPRVSLTFLQAERTLRETKADVIGSQHSRILIIGASIDEVVGIVLKQELLLAIIEGKEDDTLGSFVRSVRFVPEAVRADTLLTTFQNNQEHLAIVVDEFGGVAGVITLEDVLEVLTGEIVDETDRVVDLREWTRQRKKALLSRK
jgi:CBS domain containing-hemolysin-like protein